MDTEKTTEKAVENGEKQTTATAPTTPVSTTPEQPEAGAGAVAAAMANVQAIEGLMATFAKSSPLVRQAAQKVVDENKFKTEATPETVAALLLPAVTEAMNKPGNATAEAAREIATASEEIPDGDGEDLAASTNTKEERVVSGMVAGIKNRSTPLNTGAK